MWYVTRYYAPTVLYTQFRYIRYCLIEIDYQKYAEVVDCLCFEVLGKSGFRLLKRLTNCLFDN